MKTAVILVINNGSDIVEAARVMLESKGYCVPVAYDCSAGFAKIREVEPDLIILDACLC